MMNYLNFCIHTFWMNKKKLEKDKLMEIVSLIKDRLKKLSDWTDLTKGFFVAPNAGSANELPFSMQQCATKKFCKKFTITCRIKKIGKIMKFGNGTSQNCR